MQKGKCGYMGEEANMIRRTLLWGEKQPRLVVVATKLMNQKQYALVENFEIKSIRR